MSNQTYKFEKLIEASQEQIFYAFTNATALREWLCDVSTVDPKPGGRIFLAWNSGYYACGEYLNIEPNKRITFSWFGQNEPGVSKVEVLFTNRDGKTHVQLNQTLPGSTEKWKGFVDNLINGWETSLENLKSVLETGADLRITRRPLLGITTSDFNHDIAERLGVPVTEGIRIDLVFKGMGAEAAGLQTNDVMIEVDGKKTSRFGDIGTILEGKHAGDKLSVTFYRGEKKTTLEMILSGRKVPEIPDSLRELTKAVKKIYRLVESELETLFEEVSDSDASTKPKPDEWNAREVLAHLIHSERYLQTFITDLIGGQEHWIDSFAGNLLPPIRATLTAFPTLPELLRELKYSFAETLALYENLPTEFINRKGGYWRLAYYSLESPYHFETHILQIKESLNATKKER